MVKRIFDFILSVILILILTPILIICFILIKLTSQGAAVYFSDRIGKDNIIFRMPKFRTMYLNTPQVATHLLTDSSKYVTPIGKLLRKTSLDELPQLFSVFIGDMSFVGPRPALYNQYDLKDLRVQKGIETLKPGITGWAQINGRDTITNEEKVMLDEYYLKNKSFLFDLNILFRTFLKVFKSDDISH